MEIKRMRCAWILSKKSNVFWGALFMIVGVVFITIGVLIPRMVDDKIHSGVEEKVVVDDYTSDSYDSWRTSTLSTSAPYYKSYYFFNITNPLEVQAGQAPILQEVGPYKYKYYTEKVDVVFSHNGEEVDFKLYEHFHWSDLDNPGRSRNDTVYTVNPAYIAILTKIGLSTGSDKWEFLLKAVFFSKYLSKLYESMSTTMVSFVVSQAKIALGAALDTATAPWAAAPFPAATAASLKNPTSLYSFSNTVGGSIWYKAAAGDQSSKSFLARAWVLPEATIVDIAAWLNNQTTERLPLVFLSKFKASQADLPFVQWNTMEVLNGRLKDLVDQLTAVSPSSAPTVPPYAEFQAYSILAEGNTPSPFTTQLVKEFFLGNAQHKGFQNPSTVAQFLTLLMQNNTAAMSGLFGWNEAQTGFFIRYFNFVFANSIDAIIKRGNGGLFATNKVEELLFRYNDPLTAVLAPENNPIKVTVNNTGVEDAQTRLPTRMNTGATDVTKIFNYISWKNSTDVKGWLTPEPVAAGDGTSVPPASDPVPELIMFSQTLQRRLAITYQGNIDVKGIPLYNYQMKDNSFDNTTENPENAKYYAGVTGFHNMTSMELIAGNPGIPVFFSRPHFWMVSPIYSNLVSMKGNNRPGMNPDPERHSTYLRFEPTTGKSMDIALRLQVNVELNPAHFNVYHVVPRLYYLPVYWVEESSTLTDKQADAFKSAIESPRNSSKLARVLLLVFGTLFLIVGIALLVLATKRFTSAEEHPQNLELVR